MMEKPLLLFLALVSFSLGKAETECKTRNVTINGYYGWPLQLKCHPDSLIDYYYDELVDEAFDVQCTITEIGTGKVLHYFQDTFDYDVDEISDQFSYSLGDVSEITPTLYEIHLQTQVSSEGYCIKTTVTLQLTELPQMSCEESIESLGHIPYPAMLGDTSTVLCNVPGDFDGPKKLVDENTEGIRSYWLYNCDPDLPSNAVVGEVPNLILEKASYSQNPGTYTCVVEYKGSIRYRVHYDYCLKERSSTATFTISCPDYKTEIGKDVDIECIVDAGIGYETDLVYFQRFYKLDSNQNLDETRENISCVSDANNKREVAPDKRVSCLLASESSKSKCFNSIPSEEEIQSQKIILRMHYRIEKVRESDLGEYQAVIHKLQHNESTIFKLTLDRQPGLAQSTLIMIICIIGLVSMFLIILILFVFCGLRIRWLWKRKFGAYEKDIKTYVAYLAYFYSKSMTDTAPVQLEAFVMNLNKRIQRIGGSVFDKCKDPMTKQYVAENIVSHLSECHRVIILLTPEYIQDQWSMYEAYEAWKNVIENGIPIIFITFPTTRSAMESLNVECKNALNKALKRHKVINWKGDLPFDERFRMMLEILMPKLPRNGATEKICITDVTTDSTATSVDSGRTKTDHLNNRVFENAV